MTRPVLVLFPGLGATAALFAPLTPHLDLQNFDLMSPNFPEPADSRETLHAYLESRILPLLPKGQPLILGGFSFGGQIALELSRMVQPMGLLLISSFLSFDEIQTRFRRQVQLSEWIPDFLLERLIQNFGPKIFSRIDSLNDEQAFALHSMVQKFSLQFFRWSSRESANWRGDYRSLLNQIPILEIRGRGDKIIPKSSTRDCVEIADGGHLVTLKKPTLVAEEINRWIRSLQKQPFHQG